MTTLRVREFRSILTCTGRFNGKTLAFVGRKGTVSTRLYRALLDGNLQLVDQLLTIAVPRWATPEVCHRFNVQRSRLVPFAQALPYNFLFAILNVSFVGEASSSDSLVEKLSRPTYSYKALAGLSSLPSADRTIYCGTAWEKQRTLVS